MADRSWVDTLSEDWISQPDNSPHISQQPWGPVDEGTTHIHNSTTANSNNNCHSLASVTNQGTTHLHARGAASTPNWKRNLRDNFAGRAGGKDLFTPMQLESLFRPPTIGPNSSTESPPSPPSSPRRTVLPLARSTTYPALSTLTEESASVASSLVDETPRRRTSEPATPDIKPIPRHSLLSHRRIHASPPAGRFPVLKGKRKAEKYADIEHDTRSRIAVDESSLPRPGSVRINRAGSRWSKENLRISSDDEVRKNEAISPVSVGGLGLDSSVIVGPPPLKRGASNPEVYPRHNDDEEKQDDGVGELRNDFVRNVQKFQEGNSVYPSSPPMMQSQYLPGEEYEDDEEEDNEKNYLDDTVSQYIAPKRPPPTPPSPAYRPNSKEGAPNHGSHGSALLRNIRSHKDAPRSPIKALEPIPPKSPPSSDDDPDSFMAPHPFRNVPGLSAPAPHSPPGEKLNVPKNKHSGSPLKLFSGAYDTYTNDRLWKRLGELEKSEEQESARPSRAASLERSTDHGTEGSDGDSEGSFSGGSRVLSRLEKMVLKAERQASPVRANYSRRRHTKMVHYGDSAEEPTKSDRRMSEPVLQPSSPQLSVRKHRRWRSDESSGTPNDGVAGPMNPVKERTPKRPRRGTILTPRPGSSGVPNQLFESPVAGRRRIYGGIEEGSILASSRRQQRSRANSKESQVSARRVSATSVAATSSPTPNPRKKKHVMRDAGQVAAPAINSPRSKGSRKIVFSGCGGDGMHGESFEMPTPDKSDGDRKGSVTTQDFLLQAEEVMARLRSIAMASSGSGSSSRRGSQEVADVDQSTVPGECRRGNQSREASLSSANAGQKKAVAPRSDEPRYEEEEQEELRQSRSSRSSRLSVRVISNVPEVLAHHLATKTTNDMTFDEKSHAWISRDPGKDREEDPLQDISDLTVDPKEEERVLEMARQRWVALGSTPEGVEKSGVWRSSRVIDDSDIRELREQGCSIGGDTWDKTHWSHSRALSSSVGSASSRQTSGSGFGASCPGTGTETRTTSYGTEGNADKDVKETEMEHNDDDTTNESDVKSECEAQQRPARFDDGFSSSPLKYEVILDDSNVDGFLDHGSLRRRNPNSSFGSYRATNAHRKPLGKSFVGRPVSRITEESEDTGSHRIMEREFRKISLSSALTPIQTPFKSHLSFMPPPSESRKGEVSFYLSPLPDLSYRFETTEALVSLELSYITSRRGPKASSKAIEASFSIAQENLVKHMTDVEPYNPYWEHIKSLKLSDRRLETLHPLNEWCPMISELDVCDNELGQLAGVPETVLNLNAQRNCLSNSTYFGHLANLQFLDISGNGLESLEALRTCVHLREIRADDNALTSISGVFQIDGLMSLRCRRNRLWSVDVSRTDLKRLTELDLRGNQITSITGIECLPSLVHLNLDQNQLSTLQLPVKTKLKTIRSIKLTQNKFASFDVTPFPNLRILYMDNNQLTHVGGLTRAKSIDAVSFREQNTKSGAFTLDMTHMFEARKMYLSSNPIGTLALRNVFLNLQFLEMAGCHLRTLPKNMPALFPNVRVLNLNYNALTDLRPLAGMSRLVKLNCAGNRIRSVRKLQQALERCRAVKWVDFRSNPLTLGFYPPAVMTVARVGEEYAKDPFEVGEADRSEDERHVLRMDMEMRCERRRYWVLLAEACGKLKGVDGLVFERAGVEGEDEVWREMRKKGWLMIEEEGGEETAAGEEGSVISE